MFLVYANQASCLAQDAPTTVPAEGAELKLRSTDYKDVRIAAEDFRQPNGIVGDVTRKLLTWRTLELERRFDLR